MNNRKILWADCGSGVLILALGALAIVPDLLGRTWWLVCAMTVLAGVGTYVDEQRLESARTRKRLAIYLGFVIAAGLLLGGAVATTSLGPGVVATTAATGFGLATVLNRLIFGVIYPIPQRRLLRAEKYSM
jgi:hypothetical protein